MMFLLLGNLCLFHIIKLPPKTFNVNLIADGFCTLHPHLVFGVSLLVSVLFKNKKNPTLSEQFPQQPNIKIVQRGRNDTINTQTHDRSHSYLGTCTSIISGGVKLVVWAQTSP